MSDDVYTSTLRRLPAASALVINDIAVAATELADALAGHLGGFARGEEALAAFEDKLDGVVAPALAVIAGGSSEQRAVVLALEALAQAASGPQRAHTATADAILARALLTVTAGALVWRRLELVGQLAGVRRSDGYGPPVSVLGDADLRHLDLFERGADASFAAHSAWVFRRPWRPSAGLLCSDDLLRLALAEADVLSGMIAVGAGRERDLFSAGLTVGERRVEDRLVARAFDRDQRPVLCRLFAVADRDLEARMSDAYAGLSAGERMTRSRSTLFARR